MRKAGRWVDVGVIAAVTAVAALVSQNWPGFNSPDSEFYASLALYGSDVVDRAIEPAYIWTRLGYIAPVRGLTLAFGPWAGFEIWRILLLFVISASVYAINNISGRPRALGGVLALFTVLNTVVLSFVGNTYLTGTVMTGTFAVIALGVWNFGSASSQGRGLFGSRRWTSAALVGIILGWLVMTNPYGAILAGGIWGVLRLLARGRLRNDTWSRILTDAISVLVGLLLSFGAFITIGAQLFPGRNWISTYLEWNSRLDYTVFIGDATTWRRDTALLVLVIALVAAIAATLLLPARRWAWAALGASAATVVITVVMMVVFTGPWLESPTYVALLFPGALSALALVFIAITPGTHESTHLSRWTWVATLVLGSPALIIAGHYEDTLGLARGWAIALLALIAVVTTIGMVKREGRSTVGLSVALVVSLLVTYIGIQILQNGRGFLGIYGQFPFAAGYQDYKGREQMEAKIGVQNWLLSRTEKSDSIAIWTDPAGLGASTAAMQMWGGDNLATLAATLDRTTSDRLADIEPTVVAMYSPDPALITDFYESLPPWSLPSELDCITVDYPVVASQSMTACISRLTWVG